MTTPSGRQMIIETELPIHTALSRSEIMAEACQICACNGLPQSAASDLDHALLMLLEWNQHPSDDFRIGLLESGGYPLCLAVDAQYDDINSAIERVQPFLDDEERWEGPMPEGLPLAAQLAWLIATIYEIGDTPDKFGLPLAMTPPSAHEALEKAAAFALAARAHAPMNLLRDRIPGSNG